LRLCPTRGVLGHGGDRGVDIVGDIRNDGVMRLGTPPIPLPTGDNTMNTFTTIASIERVLDTMDSAPATYAQELSALVASGYADKLPLDIKGKPSAAIAAVIADIHEAYTSAGVSGVKALRHRTLRLKYAIHILAANPKRDEETPENFVKRCVKIRSMANAGDRDQIDKAIKGSQAKVKRAARPATPKAKPAKAAKATEAPEVPEVLSVGDALDKAHNELVRAMSAYSDAVDNYRKEGKRLTAKSVSTITTRAHNLVSLLAG
jgi:hypothetical protein